MKIRTAALLIPVLLALGVGTAFAKTAPKHAAVDPAFGKAGKTLVSSPKEDTGAAQVATTASGETYVLRQGGFVLYAFGSNGKPDPAFGTHGRIKLPLYASDLTVDPEGRVLVVGTVSPGGNSVPGYPTAPPVPASEAEVLRYLPDGSLDPSFGHGGTLRTDFGLPHPTTLVNDNFVSRKVTYASAYLRGQQISVDAEDRLIVAGSFCENVATFVESYDHAYVVRLTPGGELDPSYGSGGREVLPNTNLGTTVSSLATTPSSGAVVEVSYEPGSLPVGPGPAPGLYTLEESGQISPTFNTKAEQLYGPNLVVDPEGRILLTSGVGVTRLLPDGSFDPSFGEGGATSLLAVADTAQVLSTDAKGRVIVGIVKEGSHKLQVARLGTRGILDRSFGEGGVVRVGFGKGAGTAVNAAGIDSRGRIVAAGSARGTALSTGVGLALTRILPGS